MRRVCPEAETQLDTIVAAAQALTAAVVAAQGGETAVLLDAALREGVVRLELTVEPFGSPPRCVARIIPTDPRHGIRELFRSEPLAESPATAQWEH